MKIGNKREKKENKKGADEGKRETNGKCDMICSMMRDKTSDDSMLLENKQEGWFLMPVLAKDHVRLPCS